MFKKLCPKSDNAFQSTEANCVSLCVHMYMCVCVCVYMCVCVFVCTCMCQVSQGNFSLMMDP